jgi:hypothetical protein
VSFQPEVPEDADDREGRELTRGVLVPAVLAFLACVLVVIVARDLLAEGSGGSAVQPFTVDVLYRDESGAAYHARCEPVDDKPDGVVMQTGYFRFVHVEASEPMPDGLDVVDGSDQHLFFNECGYYQALPAETASSAVGGSEAPTPATDVPPPPPSSSPPEAPSDASGVPATCFTRAAPCSDAGEPPAADDGIVQIIEVTAAAGMRIEMIIDGRPVTVLCSREADVPASRQADVIAENSDLNALVEPQVVADAQHDAGAGAHLPPGTIAESCRAR